MTIVSVIVMFQQKQSVRLHVAREVQIIALLRQKLDF